MSIETEKKRLTDFLIEQTAAHEKKKRHARDQLDKTVAQADFAIQALKDHVARQVAELEAAANANA